MLVYSHHRIIFRVTSGKSATHSFTLDNFASLFIVAEIIVLYHVLYQFVLMNLLWTQDNRIFIYY